MITDKVLDRAVAEGLVTAEQAFALRSLARQEAPLPDEREPAPDPERLRFVSGFGDIFVTLGLVLFLGAAAYLADRRFADGFTALGIAAIAWGLAEFFTRRRRMALPSIVLLVVFVGGAFVGLSHLFASGTAGPGPRLGWLDPWLRLGDREPLAGAGAALATAALAGLHYARFRVPITVAAGTATLAVATTLALYAAAPDVTARLINPLLLGCGLVAFALAMRFDLRDPERATRRTDIAFWLHLLAAPLIVHSVFVAVGADRGEIAPGSALLVLLIFAALGAVAILVDRRALLVSGLIYAGAAFGSLVARAGITDRTVPVTLLVLGGFVLALSAGWAPLRRVILAAMPEGLVDRLPRPDGA